MLGISINIAIATMKTRPKHRPMIIGTIHSENK
jgi:hypothetical protein